MRIVLGNEGKDLQMAARCNGDGNAFILCGGPQPIEFVVFNPLEMDWIIENVSQSQHIGGLLPTPQDLQTIGMVEREVAQDRKAFGMLVGRFNGNGIGR